MLVFLFRDSGFEQDAKQELDAPGLEPTDLVDAGGSRHQATIPQFHHWPRQQEGDQD